MPGSRAACRPGWGLAPIAVVLTGLVAFPSPARGDDAVREPIGIIYRAGEGCPTEGEFLESTRRYTARWTPVPPAAARRTFEVHLARADEGYNGRLVIHAPERPTTREIAGPDCASVARGLAVIVALAIDPKARPDASHGEGEDAAGGAAEPPPPASPPEASTSLPMEGRPVRPAAPSASSDDAASAHRRERHRERLGFTFAVEARAELTTAVTSGVLPVVGASIETRARFGAHVPSWLSPSIALGVRQSSVKHIRASGGGADFIWTAATLRLCPLRLAFFDAQLEAAPCFELGFGALQAAARGLSEGRGTSTFWFDRGGSVRVSYRLSPSWAIGAGALVTAPANRNRYTVSTGELISQAPDVGVTTGLHLELRL